MPWVDGGRERHRLDHRARLGWSGLLIRRRLPTQPAVQLGESLAHPIGLPPRQLAAAGADLEDGAHNAACGPKCRARASTSPAAVCSTASIATGRPYSRAVPAVMGPITAAL